MIPSKLPHVAPVSLGPSFGMMIMNGVVFAGEAIGKGKFEVTDVFEGLCKGDKQVQAAWDKRQKSLKGFISCVDSFCCCCPCSTCYTSDKKSRHAIKK